jgi:hypothetical protein
MSMQLKAVPHNARMDKPMEPGQVITVRGKVYAVDMKADKLADPRYVYVCVCVKFECICSIIINLSAEGNGEDAQNIPFHMSIRFKAGEVVMNSKIKGVWGKEEKKKIPFKLGEDIDVRIRAHGDKFEVWKHAHMRTHKQRHTRTYRSTLIK